MEYRFKVSLGYKIRSYPKKTMTFIPRLCAVAALLGTTFSLSAADYYVADTGRTARTEVSTSAALSIVGDDGHNHTPGDGHDHGPDDSGPIDEMTVKQMVSPEVEAAILSSGIDKLGVQNEGVESTLRTFAEIQVTAITGKTKYEGMDPVYAVLGMIYQNMSWARVPMIPVEDAELAKAFGLDPNKHNRVSSVWVMKTPKARMMVMSKLQGMESPEAAALSDDAAKALQNFSYRLGTFLNLPGELKIVPMAGNPGVWLAPLHLERPELLTGMDETLARDVAGLDKKVQPYKELMSLDTALKDAFNVKKTDGLAASTGAFLAAAENADGYMSPLKRQMDYLQTTIHPFKRSAQLFMLAFFGFLIYLALLRRQRGPAPRNDEPRGQGLVDGRAEEYSPGGKDSVTSPMATALQGLNLAPAMAMNADGADAGPIGGFPSTGVAFDNTGARNYGDPVTTATLEIPKGSRISWGIAFGLMVAATVALVLALANRAYLGGRMPVSNMYESITFAMGAFAVVSCFYEAIHRRAWVGVGASFAGWVLMTMANSMPLHARKIDPLVAVLNSVWLNFHVTSLLISYSLFLLAFVFGVLFLIKDLTGNRAGVLPRAETFEYLTYRSVQFGWPLLTLGIFLGAVWANTAWGSFWSWDPKETWALITWLTYTIYLHLRINLGWNGKRSIVASMIGFVMVLLTYFGVSYLPGLAGGMHSYAEPITR